ncbi:MAG: cell division protein FtsA [Alphaproteobacteria bacterium]
MREQMRGGGKPEVVAGLDVGTSKIACVIARVEPPTDESGPDITILGICQHAAAGIRKGAVVDVVAAEEAIRLVVEAAERMADVIVQRVWVNLSTASLFSHHAHVEIPLGDQEIDAGNLRDVAAHARASVDLTDRVLIHAVPLGYQVDGSAGISDPRGMVGERLGVRMHLVSAAQGPVRNLMLCIRRCHLEVAGLVASPYASGLACLVPDEMGLGVTLVEMGAGTTSIAVFYDSRLIFTDVLEVGGQHVTSDIARGLSTLMTSAERIKTLYGSALPTPSDDQETVDVPQIDGDAEGGVQVMPRSFLTRIIQPRIEETIELVRDRLAESGFEGVAGRRIVLTGGAAQLTGVRETAARMLDKPVRIGRPLGVSGFPDTVGGPSFATCSGLLVYPLRAPQEAPSARAVLRKGLSNRHFARLKNWFTAHF